MDTMRCKITVLVFGFTLLQGVLSQTVSLTESPQDSRVREGDAVVLSCKFSSNPGDCLWTRDRAVINPNSFPGTYEFAGNIQQGDCSMRIKSALFERDDATWYCQMTPNSVSPEGLLSSPAKLTVLKPPQDPVFLTGASRQEVAPGGILSVSDGIEVEVTCISRNGNPPSRLIVTMNGVQLPTTDRVYNGSGVNSRLQTAESTGQYTFTMKDDKKELRCTAYNDAYNGGQMEAKAIVEIQAPVTNVYIVSNKDLEVSGIEGKELTITCVADGSPTPDFIWESQTKGATEWSPISNKNGQNYTFVPKSSDDGTVFKCKAYNKLNSVLLESSAVTLRITAYSGADVGAIIGILIAAIAVVLLVGFGVYYSYRKEVLCFAVSGDAEEGGETDTETAVNDTGADKDKTSPAQTIITEEKHEEGKNGKQNDDKKINGDQNDNTKPKEIVYAQLELAKPTNGSSKPTAVPTTTASTPGKDKTEYASLQFRKENQV